MELRSNYNEISSTSPTQKIKIIEKINYNQLSDKYMKEEYIKCVIIDQVNALASGVKIDRNIIAPFAVSIVEHGVNSNTLHLLNKVLNQEYNITVNISPVIINTLME